VFGVSFDEIAEAVGRTPAAARQLASRARRRVREGGPSPDADLAVQRRVVDAFLAASRAGDFEALIRVLDPEVVLRVDFAGVTRAAPRPLTGADAVARRLATQGPRFARFARPVLVNGAAGVVVRPPGLPVAIVAFTVARGRIARIDLLADLASTRVDVDGGR